jgi:hypothetical protein
MASLANFDYISATFFSVKGQYEKPAWNLCVQIGSRATQEFSREKRSSRHDCVARHDPLLALGLWLGGRVWRYRRCDFCRQRLRWPKN